MPSSYERVVIDSSVLIGAASREIVAGAALGYYHAYWSPWIVGEHVRNRIEWVVMRPGWDQGGGAERRRRLEAARRKINSAISYLSRILTNVDYHAGSDADLSWLTDVDDHPIMQTAIAAGADTLVTDNSRDFPIGERRNGVLLLSGILFLENLYRAMPEAEGAIREYLGLR